VLWLGMGSTAEAAFTAFNDVVAHSAGGGDTPGFNNPANTTEWGTGDVSSGLGPGELLDYATGNPTGVYVTNSDNNSRISGAVDYDGTMPDAGTPAHTLFNGKVDAEQGMNFYASGGAAWSFDISFSSLNPNRTYDWAGLVVTD